MTCDMWSVLGTWAGSIGAFVVGIMLYRITKKQAKISQAQAKISQTQLEYELRPVILRARIIDWDSIKLKMENSGFGAGNNLNLDNLIHFIVEKNIATDIKGYIVINGFKYELEMTWIMEEVVVEDKKILQFASWNKKIGWVNVKQHIIAGFYVSQGVECSNSNCIRITYQDIEGNEYITIENENYQQKSKKLST